MKPEKTPIKAAVKDGNLMIALPMQEPTISKSGKSYVLYNGTFFEETTAEIDGKKVKIKVFAIIPSEEAA